MHGYNNHMLEMARIDVGSEDPILLQESTHREISNMESTTRETLIVADD